MIPAMVVVFISLIAAVVASTSDCSAATCHRPRSGRGISLLQASRNKSAVPPATSNSSSSLDDALAAAEALGNATEQAISGSGAATSEDTRAFQNLSSPESASVNYSEIIVDNENQPVLRPPYTQRQNKTSPIIKPIKGATPIPEPQADNITGAMRDCLLGEWNEWSECVSDGASGYEGPHQIRRRFILQPWAPGGLKCGSTEESQGCNLISAASTIVNLNG